MRTFGATIIPRGRDAAAAAIVRRNNDVRHDVNANASPDVKQTLKVR